MNYDVLLNEISNDPLSRGYFNMSNTELLLSLKKCDRVKLKSHFASFRTLANLLTAEEYNNIKTVLSALAQSNILVADVIDMMKLPGDESGNGGGIDFGAVSVRSFIDNLVSSELISIHLGNKLKSLGKELISRAEELGISDVADGHIKSIRL